MCVNDIGMAKGSTQTVKCFLILLLCSSYSNSKLLIEKNKV